MTGRPRGVGAAASPGPSPLRALLVIALTGATACADTGPVRTGRPDRVPERRLLSTRWDTLFRMGGAESDTVFLQATRIGADAGGVSLVDGFRGRVLRWDTAGRLEWHFGRRGSGPDEFRRPRDLAVDARGRTWVLDALNNRLTVVDADGDPAFRVPLGALDRTADRVAPLAGDRAVLFTLGGARPFVTVGRDGGIRARRPVPGSGFDRLSPLAGQMTLAVGARGRIWGAAFLFADAFFLFRAAGETIARGWLPEPVPFPGVTVRTSGSPFGRQRTTKMERPRYGAVSVTTSRDRLYVLFGGEGERANRWIDGYDLSDARYAGSYLLPRPVAQIAHGAGIFYVVYHDPFPALAALRPRNGSRRSIGTEVQDVLDDRGGNRPRAGRAGRSGRRRP